jgi:hypothetical protein
MISAGAALDTSGVDVAAVRRELPLVEPYAFPIRPASRFMRRFWAKGISAVALPWAIYVTGAVFDRMATGSEPDRTGLLVVHELTHIQQYRRLGPIRHLTQYFRDYLKGRLAKQGHWEAYRSVRLEIEAREVARRFSATAGPL